MLSRNEVKHIALLSRIGVSDEEVERYRQDLSAAIDWFAELKAVVTADVEPIGHITGVTNTAASDQIQPPAPQERTQILKNMPGTKDGYTKVRSVF